jgi:hypothetical protein
MTRRPLGPPESGSRPSVALRSARVARFQDWLKARSLLHAVVDEIEAELASGGFYLGVTDDVPRSRDLAAVEIRLCHFGRPCDPILDLVVEAGGRQILRDLGGSGPPHRGALPPVAHVTADDYRTALLSYVKRVITELADLDVPAPVQSSERASRCHSRPTGYESR